MIVRRERRSGLEKRYSLFAKKVGGLRKCWERRNYVTDRRA